MKKPLKKSSVNKNKKPKSEKKLVKDALAGGVIQVVQSFGVTQPNKKIDKVIKSSVKKVATLVNKQMKKNTKKTAKLDDKKKAKKLN